MADDPERADTFADSQVTDRAFRDAAEELLRQSRSSASQESQTIALLEETALVSKRRVVTGSLKVETRTEVRQESAVIELDRRVVDVTRVPIDRLIENAPEVRTEGDTTIVSVVEERFVIVKQLFLKEELHIRHRTERETLQHSVALRRQVAVVERFDAEGRIIAGGDDMSPRAETSSGTRS